jgi:SAM-dependent methyltransferase
MQPTTTHYTNCPVCDSINIKPVFNVKDFTVSGEYFPVIECNDCSLRFTQDIPNPDFIGPYYKSEDYISHTNTSKGLINRLYQAVRKRTMVGKRKMIQRSTGVSTGRLLDIGSGTGTFAYEMKKHGWEVIGLEPDEGARKVAMELYQVELQDPAKLNDLQPKSFDAITLWHVLEHVHDLHGYLNHIRKLLKPNGKLLIAVPNYKAYDAVIYQEFWAAYDVPRHLYHFSPVSMKTLIERNEMKIEKYDPMWYDSFYISLLSSRYKQGKPNLFKAFWNGVISNCKAISNHQRCSSVVYIVGKKN